MLEILETVVRLEDLSDGLERRRRQRGRRVGRVAVDQAQAVEDECRLHRGFAELGWGHASKISELASDESRAGYCFSVTRLCLAWLVVVMTYDLVLEN